MHNTAARQLYMEYDSVRKDGPGYSSPYSDSLRAQWSGDRIPVGARFFHSRRDRPWDPPSLLYNRYRVIPGGKAAGT